MSQWFQLTAGQGPVECCYAVARASQVVVQEAAANRTPLTLLDFTAGPETGTFRSVTYVFEGATPDWLRGYLGSMLWIAESPFRPNHKRKRWFFGGGLIKQPDASKFDLTKVKLEFIRSSGPGGQNVNKVASAVRITHLPTGIQVVAQDQRSQHQNRSLAFERLKRRLQAEDEKKHGDARQKAWDNHWNLERGNPVRTFTGEDFERA